MIGETEYRLTDITQILIGKKNPVDTVASNPTRLLFGRGGHCPGLDDINIDAYPPLLYATIYRKYTDHETELIAEQIGNAFPGDPVIIQDRSIRPAVTRIISGTIPDEMTIKENGLKFLLHPLRGQNPGFFPDMEKGRELIRELVSTDSNGNSESGTGGIKVLNLFAYTCSLSVAALAAGAEKVVNIDMNRRSLDIGKRNHRLNHTRIPGGYRSQALFLPHNIFKSYGKLKKEGPYDMIIADPPPSQKGSFMLLRDYPRLIKRLPEMLNPGGKIILTHNGPGWSWEDFESMATACLPGFSIPGRVQPPAAFAPRENGRGLKILVFGNYHGN